MFSIYCKCGERLEVNEQKTLANFLSKVDYIKDDLGNICDIALKNHLIYTCVFCAAEYKFTYKELEEKIRESITYDVKEVRKGYVLRNDVNPALINPDNGMEFCGRCNGMDGTGNCYVDVINQCSYRREK